MKKRFDDLQLVMIQNTFQNHCKTVLILFTLTTMTIQKCINTTDFKYDLKEVSELVGYHSLCSQFSRRTCCSPNNFDFLAKRQGYSKKRMTKVMGGNMGLSNPCRYRLTNAMCSFCDGDIGEDLKKGVCPHYCWQFYEDCKEDYFAIDNNNQLKVCKEEDIICSKLLHIVPLAQKQNICGLLDLKVDKNACWNGQVSANFKGAARKKVNVGSRTKTRRTREVAWWQQLLNNKFLTVPLGLAGLMGGIIMYQQWRVKRALWKRQIRNL